MGDSPLSERWRGKDADSGEFQAAGALLQEMFVRLEKDFKYNLTLLKIREAEIERCAECDRDLRQTLVACTNANQELKKRISLLETALDKATVDRGKERDIYREKLAALLRNLAECKRERDICERDREVQVRKCVLETEKEYVQLLNRREMEFERTMEEMQAKLEAEIVTVAKLTRQAENSFEECTILRNKAREDNAERNRETSILRQEIDTLKRSEQTLKSKITALRNDADCKRVQIDAFKDKIRNYVEQIDNDLNAKLQTVSEENVRLKSANSRLERELTTRNRIKEKSLRNIYENTNVMSSSEEGANYCNVPEHGRYPALVKQNEVLQEIVKTLRKERELSALKQAEELKVAEHRVDKLEEVIESLKRAAANGVELKVNR